MNAHYDLSGVDFAVFLLQGVLIPEIAMPTAALNGLINENSDDNDSDEVEFPVHEIKVLARNEAVVARHSAPVRRSGSARIYAPWKMRPVQTVSYIIMFSKRVSRTSHDAVSTFSDCIRQ